ncbi:MAG: response regulator [Roseitalea sp.]|jgi:two-component SAPR family response regulator|nr:response regulator [Roseitalea sp.]MBO6723452.1 response regulator [Roseitalea sp.]MBO6742484.1 response regulator [Roseitalea sp.]
MTDQPQRIFIVEDEVIIAFEMTDTLEDMGFEVIGPSVHLEDAKDKAKDEDIDVAFIDVNLGAGKTSAPVAQILKDRGIPFVFITAYDRAEIDFVSVDDRIAKKPVSRDMLLRLLRDVWPPRKNQASGASN